MADVLVCRRTAFHVIGVEELLGRQSFEHQCELPDEIIDVLDAAVGAARAERRYQMRRVADKKRAAVAERAHAPALKRVYAGPLDLELGVLAEHGSQPRHDLFRLLLLVGVGIPAELEVHAPHMIGLAVQ